MSHRFLRSNTLVNRNKTQEETASQDVLKVYGKANSHQGSSVAINSSQVSNGSGSCIKNSKCNSTTQISQIIKSQGKIANSSSQQERTVNLTQPLKDGLIFAIVLPHILDEEKRELKQPILVKLKESDLEEFGFMSPFSDYFDKKMNCFKIKIGNFHFHCEIIASGNTPLNLKVCLQENISCNSDWKDLPKMKRLSSGTTTLQHCPLDSENDIPSKRVLSAEEITKLFTCKVHHAHETSSVDVHKISQRFHKEKDSNLLVQELKAHEIGATKDSVDDTSSVHIVGNSSQLTEQEPLKKADQSSGVSEQASSKSRKRKKDVDCLDKSTMEVAMDDIHAQVDDLIKRKKGLSELDSVSSFIISIINVLDDMRQYIDLKNQYITEISNCVPEKDLTYKIDHKNIIYLEGSIRLDLDLYDEAIRNSSPSKAPSFAYQIVKIAFPQAYWEKVTLGKKVTNEKEMARYLHVDPNCEKTKYPLSFIWGFEKPYTARMEGKFDYQLGQKRLRAFINHIFRKSKIFQYSAAAEYSVRSRIIKELCAKNTCFMKQSKNSEIEDNEDDTKDQGSNSSEEQTSDTWDIDAFDN